MLRMPVLILGFILSISQCTGPERMTFEELRCDSRINPIDIENPHPGFSWKVNAEGFNREQTAYQLLLASSAGLLNEKDADMWNTEKVSSSQSIHVKYRGPELKSTQDYWWKVRIWDEKGKVSEWSNVGYFRTGLGQESNWGPAKWICLNEDNRSSEYRFRDYKTGKMAEAVQVTSQAAGYFRNEFKLDREIESAFAYICGLGYYELYINGEKTGDHVLDPAPSNYDKQAYYVSYDVTAQLKKGSNAIGVILGNGFYGQNLSWKNDPESEKDLSYGIPAARLLIKLHFKDGTETMFCTDEQWKASTGPIVFDNIYGGEIYDSRYEIDGWKETGFGDKDWLPVRVIEPDIGKVSAQGIPPIRRLYELKPQKVFKSSKDKWIVDFGVNIAGWVQIKVKENEGQAIKIVPTEALTVEGDDIFPGSTGGGANGMSQMLKFICKGEGTESWEPRFTYHGFRYVEIAGLSKKPDSSTIKAIVVATDMEQNGSFSCSSSLLNRMDSVSRWTIIGNMHGIPEDCPHREKCGWLGDAHAFCEYALYNYDLLSFYKKYMEDIRTQMRAVKGNKGQQTFMVPTMIAPGKRTSSIAKLDWGVATMYLPWYNYLYYGDSSIVSEYYEDMKDLTLYYLSFKDDRGIIQNGMGDWCPPRWDRRNNPGAMECHPVVSANAYFFDILGIMEVFAGMNNDPEFEQEMAEEKRKLFEAFNDTYLEDIPQTAFQWYGSQTATVQALQFGMVPESELGAVVDGLEYDIITRKGGHHSTGIHGNRYIYTVLSKYGKAELAHEILTTPAFPSQAYILNNGFTTWPERQFEWDKKERFTNSLNHPMHSGFAAYFFESLGGIKTMSEAPGYREFTVHPIFPAGISQAEVNVPTPYGNIRSSWEREDVNFSMELTVPFNTRARLLLSEIEFKSLKINGGSWDSDDPVLILGSGEYEIEYLKPEKDIIVD